MTVDRSTDKDHLEIYARSLQQQFQELCDLVSRGKIKCERKLDVITVGKRRARRNKRK